MSNLENFIDGEVISATAKQCTKCKEVFSYEHGFSKNKSKKDGFQDWCKKCQVERWQIYYQNNKVRLNEKTEIYARENPEQTAFFSKRRHAKEKGTVFTILPENWIPVMKQGICCPDCGVAIKWYQRIAKRTKRNGNASTQDSSGSFDQIECGKGYIEGNVRIICHGCNMQKGTLRVKEWIGVLKVRLEEGTIDAVDPVLVSFVENDE